MATDDPQIGKDVIESLTLGMYEDCRFIYREYIQNAADQIDKAVSEGLLEKCEATIFVTIDANKRRIVIEDNATGICRNKVVPILRNIAHSTKQRGVDKGFRGIGRLGGLGYCSTLIFETSFAGEPVKSIMTWDAELLKNIINDRGTQQEAVDVLKEVTTIETKKEKEELHYFKVILEDVTSDDLLNVDSVRDYLSMVAPIEIQNAFIYRNKINQFMKDNGLTVDTYNIYINGDQIYKPYTNYIYEDNNGGKKKVDDILDVHFLLQRDSQTNEIIYWGWYSISRLRGQMKQKNIARGIRLRKSNIQIGDEEICKKFFTKTEDQRFSFYFFGEIHAVSNGLIPNSRRDYFGESAICRQFEQLIKRDFLNLRELCYDASKYSNAMKTINKAEELREKIARKDKEGYISQTEKEKLLRTMEEHERKAEAAKRQLERVQKKMEETDSPLLSHLENITENTSAAKLEKTIPTVQVSPVQKTKFRTDKTIYSKFNKSDRKLIGRIYDSILRIIPGDFGNQLIDKIEEDLTK